MVTEFFTVITDQWQIVLGILLFIALGQGLVRITLKNVLGSSLTAIEYFSLGLAGWLLPLFLLSLLWFALGPASTGFSGWMILIVGLLLVAILLLFKLDSHLHFRFAKQIGSVRQVQVSTRSGECLEPASKKFILALFVFCLISPLLRLAFVSRAILPSYFDSAHHYGMIKNILQNGTALPFPSTLYYHPGFHILTAFLVAVLHVDIARTMLILGQMVLALMPVSVFFLIKRVSGSNNAAMFGVLLAAFGWYMPAHAMNWGKYPALMSLALLPFVLSLAYWLAQHGAELSLKKRWSLYILFGLSTVTLVVFHSRSLIILSVVFLAWFIASWLQRFSLIGRSFIFGIIFLALVLQILFIQKEAVFTPLFDPYLDDGIWVTALVLFLSIFALKEYPQVTFACFLSICLLLAGIFIPVHIPGYGVLTLLDRPLVEMVLYLPLAFLGGSGLAGLEKILPQVPLRILSYGKYLYIFGIGLIVFHALDAYKFYPSDCCVLAGPDDIAALDWMKGHLPVDARIGISATELNVLQSDELEGYAGADAGIWILPLTERFTLPLLYSSDFGQEAVKDALCQSGITHLYVGELGQPFDAARLQEHPEWYRVLLSMPKVGVYEVVGCR